MPSIPADRLELIYPEGPPPWDQAPDCAAICVGGRYTRQAATAYTGTGIEIVTLIDWPRGLGKPTVRQIEAVAAAKDGTHTIDIPAPPEFVRGGNLAALREDVQGIVIAVREVSRSIRVRVEFEGELLTADRERFGELVTAVRECGGDAVVLSGEGFESSRLNEIKSAAQGLALVVRGEMDRAQAYLAAGAERVGVRSAALDHGGTKGTENTEEGKGG